tara:strand:+ start:909 stop:1277 length:369 start_codon:yes stop_codon:yes gene_type:complete
MAHFAKIVDGIVTDVIVVDNSDILNDDGNESETIGKAFCTNLFGGNWVQTSYNKTFRKNYAGLGDTYDETLDGFISPSVCPSWILNETTCKYEAPLEYPSDTENHYMWDEDNQQWIIIDLLG